MGPHASGVSLTAAPTPVPMPSALPASTTPRNTGPTSFPRSPDAPPLHRPPEAWGGPSPCFALSLSFLLFLPFYFEILLDLQKNFKYSTVPVAPDRSGKLGSSHVCFSQFPGLEAPIEVSGDLTSDQAPSWSADGTSSQSPHAETVPRLSP